ncbi:L,D-transpeptidase family protein [Bacillaceae bacterium Marseille-Q3522]|nr:L,D-transpeptidase family protein [Bacillaceae bacterium Marseille-Q3522]
MDEVNKVKTENVKKTLGELVLIAVDLSNQVKNTENSVLSLFLDDKKVSLAEGINEEKIMMVKKQVEEATPQQEKKISLIADVENAMNILKAKQAEEERLAREQAEKERIAKEQAEKEMLAKAETEKAAKEQAEKHAAANNASNATNPAPSTPAKLVVENFHTLGNAQQVILVTASKYNSRQAAIRTFEKTDGTWKQVHSFSGVIGKKGFTDHKTEGDTESPTGKYSIGIAFGSGGNPGTKLPYRQITNDDVWVDDSNSPLYNTWQSRAQTQGQWNSAENMNIPLYELGFVINYNTERIPGRGSAIFFHIAGSSGYTAGCTATSRQNVLSILQWLDPAKSPVIIQSPESELGKY